MERKYQDNITEIKIGEAMVWLLSLAELSEESFAEMDECCDADRREKTARIVPEWKRKQSIGAGCLLYLLRKKFSIDSEVIYLPDGKPVFKEENLLYFNISHSGKFAALAYGSQPLGLDIECVREAREKVAKRFFAEEEYREVLNKEGVEKDNVFFRIWTGKEAVLKAAGTGLRVSPDSFSVLPGEAELLGKRYALSGKLAEINGQRVWVSVAVQSMKNRAKV